MKNKFLVFLSIILISAKLSGQAPGYLGKKFAVGYAFTFMPFPSITDIRNTDGSHLTISSFNTRQNFEINYVVSEKGFIMLNYSLQNWGVITNLDEEGNFIKFNSPYENNLLSEIGVSDFKYINATSNKFTFSYGKSSGVAPRGAYTSVGLSLERITPQVTDLNNKTFDLPTINAYGIVCRVGKRRIFYDKILLDLSTNIELGANIFNFPGSYEASYRRFSGGFDDNFNSFSLDDLNQKVKKQSSYYSLLSIRFGIYYLL